MKEDNIIIDELTIIDSETGLYNRDFFDKTYLSEYHRARRIKHPIALLFLETENIKDISMILKSSIKRDTDFLSRYERNLFVAVMYDTNSDGVDLVIKRIMDNLNSSLIINMGIHAGIPDGHTSSRNLLNQALKALTKSKNRGDNIIEFSLNSI